MLTACIENTEGFEIAARVSRSFTLNPEADIYQTFLKRFNAKAEECIFIDDKPINISGCKKVGMQGILFQSTEQLEEELKRMAGL